MRGALRALALAALAGLTICAHAGANPAAQLYPIDLRVNAGDDGWTASNVFMLDWDQPPIAGQGFPVTAVEFQVRDAAGAVVVPTTRLPWDKPEIERLPVPPLPGIYTADVWLRGPAGEPGPPVSARLRFDDVAPGRVEPRVPAGWIAGTADVLARLEPPAGPLPVSGIRGYAVSVDGGAGTPPCAEPGRCSPAETDVAGAVGTASLGVLPEGAHVVHALAVSGSGVSSETVGSAVVRVDATRPGVALTGVPRDWVSGPVHIRAEARDALSGMRADGPGGPYTAIAVDDAVPKTEPGGAATATVSGEGVHSIVGFARDAAGNSSEGSPSRATISIDRTAPTVVFARNQDPAEPERIEATVDDRLSGPSHTQGSISLRPTGSRGAWQTLPTKARSGRLIAVWDSDSSPAGSYEFRATGYDAAGNAGESLRRPNGTRTILRNPLKSPTRVEAGFGSAGSSARSVRYAHGARYRGRLTLASGAPLANVRIEIVERFDPGSDSSQRLTIVETARDGSFESHLDPGPSRQVEAVFAGSRLLTRSSSGAAHLDVGAGVRFGASARTARVGGAPIVFRGRLSSLGAELPAEGMPVELQFRFGRGRWLEFRTVQTDARGRFSYAYEFSDDDSRGVRFQFRAYIRGSGRPYEPAASKPVIVTGR